MRIEQLCPGRSAWLLAGRGVTLALTMALAWPAGAENMYRWTDAEGNVHYADRPPPAGEARDVSGPEQPTVRQTLELERELERQRDEAEQGRARERAARLAAVEASAPKDQVYSDYTCQEARRFMKHYAQSSDKFYTRNADGTFVRSNPEQIQQTLAEWQRAADVLCEEGIEIVPKTTE